MKTLNIHNSKIYYERIDGDRHAPCIVFLHEGLGCTPMWKTFPQDLCRATGWRGLVYDRLGHGRSSALVKPRTIHFMHEYALIELPEVLSRLIPETPYVLVGHSDGGSIALIHASEKPPMLQAVITEAAHVFVEAVTVDAIQMAGRAFQAGKLKRLSDYHGDKTDSIFKAWHDIWVSYGFAYWNIEYLLPSIECPLLVMQGIDDQYGSSDQVRAIASKVSGKLQTAMIPNCRHVPHNEAPETTIETMKNFLMQLDDALPKGKNDGFVKSPDAALRCILRRCGVP